MTALDYNNNKQTSSVLFTFPFSAIKTTTLPKTVQVTGTFNDWQRTDPLVQNQDQARFELEVRMDLQEKETEKGKDVTQQQKILFKFVLDDEEWVTDATQARERDQAGNMNNVLFLDSITRTAANTSEKERSKQEVTTSTEGSSSYPVESTKAEQERLARLKQEAEDDETIRQLGGGIWGAPFFSVNDPVNLPEHFVESTTTTTTTIAQKDEQEKHEAREEMNAPTTPAQHQQLIAQEIIEPDAVPADLSKEEQEEGDTIVVAPAPAVVQEEEDEDDETIRRLGGGMWGTPFFKVNDPAALPEHFVEAMGAASITTNVTSSEQQQPVQETVIVDKEEKLSEGEILQDNVSATMEGTLIETVVETTEDTVIEDAEGNFLEESITTCRQDMVQGEVRENVTEVIETIEEIKPADPTVAMPLSSTAAATAAVDSQPQMTVTETEVTSVGVDGMETTVLEETITFVEGPEVDSDSLHSLTTSIKPVQEGESFFVESAPEVHVQAPLLPPIAGDAKPFMDLSTITHSNTNTASTTSTTSDLSHSSTARTSVHFEGDGCDHGGVVYLQGQQSIFQSGDAKPAADMSVQVVTTSVETHTTTTTAHKPTTSTAATTAPAVQTTTEKSEKRKSFWKKIKKVLS